MVNSTFALRGGATILARRTNTPRVRRLASAAGGGAWQNIRLLPRSAAFGIPLLAAGVWLGSNPERPDRVVRYAGAVARAVRLAVCCTQIAVTYRSARAGDGPAGSAEVALDADRVRHRRLQVEAWKAEQARSDAVDRGASPRERAAAEAAAAVARDEAGALGEQIAARSLEVKEKSHNPRHARLSAQTN